MTTITTIHSVAHACISFRGARMREICEFTGMSSKDIMEVIKTNPDMFGSQLLTSCKIYYVKDGHCGNCKHRSFSGICKNTDTVYSQVGYASRNCLGECWSK